MTLTSPDGRYDGLYLNNFGVINIQNELARLPGVGSVSVFGAGSYAMRIWMDPDKMQAVGLNPSDVVNAIQKQSQEVTPGQLGMPPAPNNSGFHYTVNIQGRLNDVADYENIIVKSDITDGGRITRVRDIGRVELGAQSYSKYFPRTTSLPPASPSSSSGRQCAGRLPARGRQDGGAEAELPRGPDLQHPLQHHLVRHRFHRRGLQDLV